MCLCSESWNSFNINLVIVIIIIIIIIVVILIIVIILMFSSSMRKMLLVKFLQKRHSQVIFHLEFTRSVTCIKKKIEFKVKHSKNSLIGETGEAFFISQFLVHQSSEILPNYSSIQYSIELL